MADPLLVVVGPTASGKTGLAVRLAEQLGGEIIGADSVQVYRRFDVGSGKPTDEELARAPHHLVDFLDPRDPIDAARWAELADQAIGAITDRGRRPIVCGGTFLWVKALLYGLAEAPPADEDLREQHRAIAESRGRDALHQMLAGVDPKSAERLAPNDFVRVSRALEVFELSGVPLSDWQADHGFRDPRYTPKLVGVAHPREELDQRISERVVAMLEAGWVAEVEQLIADGYGDVRAMRSVGYRQIADALAAGSADPDSLRDPIYRATRIFARRQRTWLRDQSVDWLSPEEAAAGDLASCAP